MNIFDHDDYKKWVNQSIQKMPRAGRGQYKRIAEFLNTSSTIVTQVFKGDRDLTPEQAVLLSEYFALSKMEQRFLILLVNDSRAASHRYKKILKAEIEELRNQARKIETRMYDVDEITDEAKAILYSNWYYLAIWSLAAIKGFDHLDAIIEKLNLDRKKAREALEFLVKYSLIIEKGGKFKIGPSMTYLDSDSPHLARHHQNWRLQAFNRYENLKAGDYFFTAPVTLSEKDAGKIREKLLQFISESISVVKDSPSEKFYCLCADWFEI